MTKLDKITSDPPETGGEPCIRGTSVTVGAAVEMIAGGTTSEDYPTKPRPNHQLTLRILRGMSSQEKLSQVFKLNDRTRELMRIGLRRRFPNLDDADLERVYLQMRARCHNRNY